MIILPALGSQHKILHADLGEVIDLEGNELPTKNSRRRTADGTT